MRRFGGCISAAVSCLALAGFGIPAAAHARGSVYAANSGGTTISQYSVDSRSGALTPKVPPAVATDRAPRQIAVSPDGKSAYVASFNGAVSQYTISAATGVLEPKNPATVAAGMGPSDVAVSPDGRNAYVANSGSKTVSQYTIHPGTGRLSPMDPPTVTGGQGRSPSK